MGNDEVRYVVVDELIIFYSQLKVLVWNAVYVLCHP